LVWCCPLRARFIVAIVGEAVCYPLPVDVVGYMDFDHRSPIGTPILKARFCMWCGKQITASAPVHKFDFTGSEGGAVADA
jgi:hypothetical protein